MFYLSEYRKNDKIKTIGKKRNILFNAEHK